MIPDLLLIVWHTVCCQLTASVIFMLPCLSFDWDYGIPTRCAQLHSCALSSGGAIFCWGRNGDGQVILAVCFQGAVVCHGECACWAYDDVFPRRLGTAPLLTDTRL